MTVGGRKLRLHILVTRQLIETGNDQIGFEKPVTRARGFELVVCQNLKREMEAAVEFVLPLLCETAWADHQAAMQIAPGNEFLDEKPCHDRLASAWIIGQQEA